MCDQVNLKGGIKTASLAVYTRAATDSTFRFYGIDRAGGAPRQTELVISGNRWTYRSGFQAGSTQVNVRTVNTFESPSRVSFQTEFSTDGTTWTRMADGHSAKLRP